MRFLLGLFAAAFLHGMGLVIILGQFEVWYVVGAAILGLVPGAIIGEVYHLNKVNLHRLVLACVVQALCTWIPADLAWTWRAGAMTLFLSYVVGQIVGVVLALLLLLVLPSYMITITCKIPESLDAKLEALARRRRVSKSKIVREAIEDQLRREGDSQPAMAIDFVRHLCGILYGPKDISSNPKYMEGFGA